MTESTDKHLLYCMSEQQQLQIKDTPKETGNEKVNNKIDREQTGDDFYKNVEQQQQQQKEQQSKQRIQKAADEHQQEIEQEQLSNNRKRNNNNDQKQLEMELQTTKLTERSNQKEECGTQRVYKKTSPNCLLTLYLPTREIVINGNNPAVVRGIVFVDPNSLTEGCRLFAQLTLTFRYGREDEEVMGLRFCNEAIMSLDQLYPQNGQTNTDALTPLQEALQKRLGESAYAFTLNLTPQAPASVQLVPAKRYYGAPIGTSYDVRCFIVDKSVDKFHRIASVKMGVRVIVRSEIYVKHNACIGPENYASLSNNSNTTSPITTTPVTITSDSSATATDATSETVDATTNELIVAAPLPATLIRKHTTTTITTTNTTNTDVISNTNSNNDELKKPDENASRSSKSRKTERSESFAKLRLSPKSFRFSGRFGRSKSEIEKSHNNTFYNYSKSFQEINNTSCCTGGPQGAVDKPFLLQDGRVGLKASLNKSWYAHGEEITVTIHICNDSRKTVRKIRVCAIQHVDVCMFNNGKFKNVVADTDIHSPVDRVVAPGDSLSTTVKLKPQRGTTKNWLALEDSLQRSTEPTEISGNIAASALRTPQYFTQTSNSPNYCYSPGVYMPPSMVSTMPTESANTTTPIERNVFAIYVSYYVKVKLTLSGMGGELSLKLPFILVHLNDGECDSQFEKLTLDEAPLNRKFSEKAKRQIDNRPSSGVNEPIKPPSSINQNLDCIESLTEDKLLETSNAPRKDRPVLKRSLTICKNIEEENLESFLKERDSNEVKQVIHIAQIHNIASETKEPHDRDKTEEKTEESHKSGFIDVTHEKEQLITTRNQQAT